MDNQLRSDPLQGVPADAQALLKLIAHLSRVTACIATNITFAKEFQDWANLVYSTEGDGAVSLRNFRKDIIINLHNLQGTIVRSYKVFSCWVSEYTALPELDANANAIAFESIVLQNQGFERDADVKEVLET